MSRRKDPNPQNFPVGTGDGKRIRDVFLSPRVKAALERAKNEPDAVKAGTDVHTAVAEAIFTDPPKDEEEAKARRLAAMSVNFHRLYGSKPATTEELSEKLKADRED